MSTTTPPMPERLIVRLYLAGDAPNSIAALANLRIVLQQLAHHPVELEVLDVLLDPDRAERDGVFVTPLLIRAAPPPERRVLGKLQDHALLLAALGLGEPMHE